MAYSTEQEAFWEGEFGDEYTARNQGARLVSANFVFFAKVLARTWGLSTVLELGANRGLNLLALRQLIPDVRLSAVEINPQAAMELRTALPDVDLTVSSILDFNSNASWDLVFTKGVLIHINPEKLPQVYDLMYQRASRYLLLAEYYNPKPVEIPYRGHSGRLFKRDFAGELLDRHPGLSLVDCGFAYHRDDLSPQDDLTWF